VADFYETGWTDTYNDPVVVSLFELLGPVSGQKALDVACGHGRISRELARRGAHVVGVDLSAALVDKARTIEDEAPLGVEYVQADIGSWAPPPGLFDAVTCCFGLSDIDDLDGLVDTVVQALRSGGRFVFCLLHPCFAGDGDVSGSWPTDATYYDEGWWLPAGRASSLRRQVGANHRMLSTYLNRFVAHRLRFDAIVEPPPPGAWTAEELSAAKFPAFLAGRCIKL
jgi:SAM-dependent methyltransferase